MKTTDIEKICQLTKDIRLFIRNMQNYSGLVEQAMIYEAKTDEIIALLPCETCSGTGEVDWICRVAYPCRKTVSSSCRICDFYIPGNPCPNCTILGGGI